MTTEEALERIVKMACEARNSGFDIQLSVRSAFGCGFEGNISEEVVFSIVDKYLENGFNIISLADTSGYANPNQVQTMFNKINAMSSEIRLACHFHNTFGLGMANVFASLTAGVEFIETAFGGLGGCPYTKTAVGNVSTEDFVHYLHRINLNKDIDLNAIISMASEAESFFVRNCPAMFIKMVV